MPPPPPRFKRPRIDDASAATASADQSLSSSNDPPPAAYQGEYYCVSPDDENEGLAREAMDPSAIDFERFENDNIDGVDESEGEAIAHRNAESRDENNEDSVVEAPSPKLKIEIPRTSFRDIIGQGAAKLRLDEALLPLALCESVLTGE